jgi:hypothetical protein
MLAQSESRYNLRMTRTAQQLLEEARQLAPAEWDWLIQNLLDEDSTEHDRGAFAAWQKEAGEPEPGYDKWFRAGVEHALADPSDDVSHDQVVDEISGVLDSARKAQRLKESA